MGQGIIGQTTQARRRDRNRGPTSHAHTTLEHTHARTHHTRKHIPRSNAHTHAHTTLEHTHAHTHHARTHTPTHTHAHDHIHTTTQRIHAYTHTLERPNTRMQAWEGNPKGKSRNGRSVQTHRPGPRIPVTKEDEQAGQAAPEPPSKGRHRRTNHIVSGG